MTREEFKKTIQFALEKENEAVDFYEQCSGLTTRSGMKEAFKEMADEERKHVRMLENIKPASIQKMSIQEIPNLKISDYLVDMKFTPGMSYRDLLILAMKREEKSVALYTSLKEKGGDPNIVKLFQILAQEELKHKNRLEREFDDAMRSEN